ncbi:MAG: ATP-binding protein [Myxococcota bacterium]|nr:ATP-binding protein [Myxococcota bacterium]
MSAIVRFIKANPLLLGFAVFIIPLLVLLWFQYIWLDKLAQASAIAEQVALRNYLDAVAKDVSGFYRAKADALLDIPQRDVADGDYSTIVDRWSKADLLGIRRLYLVHYGQVGTGTHFVFDPHENALISAPGSDESLAVILACLPWQTRTKGTAAYLNFGLQVNEQDPNHRIVLNPVVGENKELIAIAAFVVDQSYFAGSLLKTAAAQALTTLSPKRDTENLVVVVRNKENEVVFGSVSDPGSISGISLGFPFVFTDWRLHLYNPGPTPEQWARNSFNTNMGLALLLVVTVLGGLALALRTAGRAMRLSEMKSDFVSNVSHELRTPLASIRVFAEFLRQGKVKNPEKIEEYGEIIELETQRLTRLIDNILDFSRIESERKTYRFVPTDLAEVIQSVLKSFSLRLGQADVELLCDLPDTPLAKIQADPEAIGLALHNLLDNAVKYSKDTEPANRRIGVRLAQEDGVYVISVADTGIGISKEEQGRIFDRFHRVSTRLVHDIKGSGLGLAIVYHIMRAHHGTVTVSSELGQGSTFYLRLPVSAKGTGGQRNSRSQGTIPADRHA